MRHCPTQAIRVKGGKAFISEELCVDCGTCLSVCPAEAIVPITDPVTEISRFKYKVVVPSPVLYSQFDSSVHPYIIHLAFKNLGFDEVVDGSASSAALTRAMVKYVKKYNGRLPLISSHCPSMLRLIQVKYPDLVELIVPFDVPREITAREIRRSLPAKLGLKPEDIGIVYIAPCPAKIVSIKQPAEKARSWFDGVVSIKDVYSVLHPHIVAIKEKFDQKDVAKDFSFSPGWATLGGMTRAVEMENWLAVSGLDHVKKILDDIENSRLRNVDFVEAMACMLGCIGGSLNVENPYVARTNNIKQRAKYENRIRVDDDEIDQRLKEGYYFIENPILPRATTYFDTDLATSIKRMKERERVYQKLPQTDCGCCGAPTCMVFAEDFVRGEAELTDCIFFSEKGGKEGEEK
jgi:iron only hydrogenase large subunit-like protein